MSSLLELFHNLIDPVWIMAHGGLYIVLFIVFAETGLFVGFFLPGDTLLFITGMIIANTVLAGTAPVVGLLYWIFLISCAGIIGNYMGYWFGRSGSALLERDGRFLKKKYLQKAKVFYDKNGGKAIVLARFLPIIRTFAPIVAGMVRMDMRTFSFFNILGSFLWVGSIVATGFLLGDNEWVKDNMEKIIIGIVAVTTIPVVVKLLAGEQGSKKSSANSIEQQPNQNR